MNIRLALCPHHLDSLLPYPPVARPVESRVVQQELAMSLDVSMSQILPDRSIHVHYSNEIAAIPVPMAVRKQIIERIQHRITYGELLTMIQDLELQIRYAGSSRGGRSRSRSPEVQSERGHRDNGRGRGRGRGSGRNDGRSHKDRKNYPGRNNDGPHKPPKNSLTAQLRQGELVPSSDNDRAEILSAEFFDKLHPSGNRKWEYTKSHSDLCNAIAAGIDIETMFRNDVILLPGTTAASGRISKKAVLSYVSWHDGLMSLVTPIGCGQFAAVMRSFGPNDEPTAKEVQLIRWLALPGYKTPQAIYARIVLLCAFRGFMEICNAEGLTAFSGNRTVTGGTTVINRHVYLNDTRKSLYDWIDLLSRGNVDRFPVIIPDLQALVAQNSDPDQRLDFTVFRTADDSVPKVIHITPAGRFAAPSPLIVAVQALCHITGNDAADILNYLGLITPLSQCCIETPIVNKVFADLRFAAMFILEHGAQIREVSIGSQDPVAVVALAVLPTSVSYLYGDLTRVQRTLIHEFGPATPTIPMSTVPVCHTGPMCRALLETCTVSPTPLRHTHYNEDYFVVDTHGPLNAHKLGPIGDPRAHTQAPPEEVKTCSPLTQPKPVLEAPRSEHIPVTEDPLYYLETVIKPAITLDGITYIDRHSNMAGAKEVPQHLFPAYYAALVVAINESYRRNQELYVDLLQAKDRATLKFLRDLKNPADEDKIAKILARLAIPITADLLLSRIELPTVATKTCTTFPLVTDIYSSKPLCHTINCPIVPITTAPKQLPMPHGPYVTRRPPTDIWAPPRLADPVILNATHHPQINPVPAPHPFTCMCLRCRPTAKGLAPHCIPGRAYAESLAKLFDDMERMRVWVPTLMHPGFTCNRIFRRMHCKVEMFIGIGIGDHPQVCVDGIFLPETHTRFPTSCRAHLCALGFQHMQYSDEPHDGHEFARFIDDYYTLADTFVAYRRWFDSMAHAPHRRFVVVDIATKLNKTLFSLPLNTTLVSYTHAFDASDDARERLNQQVLHTRPGVQTIYVTDPVGSRTPPPNRHDHILANNVVYYPGVSHYLKTVVEAGATVSAVMMCYNKTAGTDHMDSVAMSPQHEIYYHGCGTYTMQSVQLGSHYHQYVRTWSSGNTHPYEHFVFNAADHAGNFDRHGLAFARNHSMRMSDNSFLATFTVMPTERRDTVHTISLSSHEVSRLAGVNLVTTEPTVRFSLCLKLLGTYMSEISRYRMAYQSIQSTHAIVDASERVDMFGNFVRKDHLQSDTIYYACPPLTGRVNGYVFTPSDMLRGIQLRCTDKSPPSLRIPGVPDWADRFSLSLKPPTTSWDDFSVLTGNMFPCLARTDHVNTSLRYYATGIVNTITMPPDSCLWSADSVRDCGLVVEIPENLKDCFFMLSTSPKYYPPALQAGMVFDSRFFPVIRDNLKSAWSLCKDFLLAREFDDEGAAVLSYTHARDRQIVNRFGIPITGLASGLVGPTDSIPSTAKRVCFSDNLGSLLPNPHSLRRLADLPYQPNHNAELRFNYDNKERTFQGMIRHFAKTNYIRKQLPYVRTFDGLLDDPNTATDITPIVMETERVSALFAIVGRQLSTQLIADPIVIDRLRERVQLRFLKKKLSNFVELEHKTFAEVWAGNEKIKQYTRAMDAMIAGTVKNSLKLEFVVKKDEFNPCNDDPRSRNISAPTLYARTLLSVINHYMLIILKQQWPHIILSMNSKQAAARIFAENTRKGLVRGFVKFYGIDGASFDAHQGNIAINAVEFQFFDMYLDACLAISGVPLHTWGFIRRLFYCEVWPVTAYQYHKGGRVAWMRGEMYGTVPSGVAPRTTLGNCLRQYEYLKLVCHEAGLNKSQYNIFVTGDDCMVCVHTDCTQQFEAVLPRYFTKHDTGVHGLGQKCDGAFSFDTTYPCVDFLSKIYIQTDTCGYFNRLAHRALTMSCYASPGTVGLRPNQLSPAQHASAVTASCNATFSSDPMWTEFLTVRNKLAPTTSKSMAHYQRLNPALAYHDPSNDQVYTSTEVDAIALTYEQIYDWSLCRPLIASGQFGNAASIACRAYNLRRTLAVDLVVEPRPLPRVYLDPNSRPSDTWVMYRLPDGSPAPQPMRYADYTRLDSYAELVSEAL